MSWSQLILNRMLECGVSFFFLRKTPVPHRDVLLNLKAWYGITNARRSTAYFMATSSTDEANAAQRNVEDKQRVYCNSNAVPDHARAAHDADSCRQRPRNENEIDGYSDNRGYAHCAEQRGDDERKQRVADDRDGLEEGTGGVLACPS